MTYLSSLSSGHRMCVRTDCQQDYPVAFKDIALINTFLKKYLYIYVYICPFLQDLSQGNPHFPWVVNPPALSLWRTGSSVALRSPQQQFVNQLEVYLHRHPFPHLFPSACQGTTDLGLPQVKDKHFFIPHFCHNFFSLLPVVK